MVQRKIKTYIIGKNKKDKDGLEINNCLIIRYIHFRKTI